MLPHGSMNKICEDLLKQPAERGSDKVEKIYRSTRILQSMQEHRYEIFVIVERLWSTSTFAFSLYICFAIVEHVKSGINRPSFRQRAQRSILMICTQIVARSIYSQSRPLDVSSLALEINQKRIAE